MPNEMQAQWNTSWLDSGNQSYLDNLYEAYLKNHNDIPKDWQNYFQHLSDANPSKPDVSHADIREYFKHLSYQTKKTITNNVDATTERLQIAVEQLINAYRLFGHMYSDINPIAKNAVTNVPELELEHYNLHNIDMNTMLNAADLYLLQQYRLKPHLPYLQTNCIVMEYFLIYTLHTQVY